MLVLEPKHTEHVWVQLNSHEEHMNRPRVRRFPVVRPALFEIIHAGSFEVTLRGSTKKRLGHWLTANWCHYPQVC